MERYRRVKVLGKGSFGTATLVTKAGNPSEKYVVVRPTHPSHPSPLSRGDLRSTLFFSHRSIASWMKRPPAAFFLAVVRFAVASRVRFFVRARRGGARV